jgi:peptidoglycan/LPS O-acetylase OafA/YrhL
MNSLEKLINQNHYSNNLTILRFIFATLVLYSHGFVVMGWGINGSI